MEHKSYNLQVLIAKFESSGLHAYSKKNDILLVKSRTVPKKVFAKLLRKYHGTKK